MSELTDQIQEISDNLDQFQGDAQSILDDHSQTLDDHSQSLSDLSGKAGQLDFPLTVDSVQRIKELFPTGKATLVAGTVTVNDSNIQTTSVVIYSITSSSVGSLLAAGNPYLSYYYTLGNGTITFNSTIGTDTSTLSYVIF